MKRKLIPMVLGLMLLTGSALALPPMLKVFESAYKVGEGSKLHKAACVICHATMGKPKLNPYGEDIKKLLGAAKTKTLTEKILRKVEKLDSDKDGVKNIAEIKADTLPGDPKSKPASAKGK